MSLPEGRGVHLGHALLWVSNALLDHLEYAAEYLNLHGDDHKSEREGAKPDLVVDYQANHGVTLIWNIHGKKKPLEYHIDYFKLIAGIRSFPAPKQPGLNQALGKKTRTVVDATGGWGNDAVLLATQGYQVAVFERNPLMALMVREALSRLRSDVESRALPMIVPTLTFGSAADGVANLKDPVDCVYLDPMFPPKRKKSAAANKNMQLLQWLVGEDADASEELSLILESGVKRVAVKRPDYALPLLDPPSQQFFSKLVHYDVYLST